MGDIAAGVRQTNLALTQLGAGFMALVSHVNAGNAALTASGIANLPAQLPVQEQVAIVPVAPTPPAPVSCAEMGIAGVPMRMAPGRMPPGHDASATAGAATQLPRPNTGGAPP